ncbi:MAG TPA: MOSC domain-containing protein [Phenylobacterium sp.]|uniref:MOSC domain-containing protein n=1 Tax=Phenylobacterium sp. TaxID=1871053 RepID=UPI002B48BBF4|nr:MOSC domain-containing protein [Phenylobacterium sp.]HKR90097.1 MOSC domain-containing protein [Phenylobacterium sp.]
MDSPAAGTLRALYRHPVKGFTPEPLSEVALAPDAGFPFDRVWAVENGPSGFDPEAPAFVPKQRFTVLAAIPRVAAAATRYDEATGMLHAQAEGLAPFTGPLDAAAGRAAFAAWLGELLGEEAKGPLKVVAAPSQHRFTDHPQGQVSLINLASVRDLSARMGAELDPLRFRANLYVDGWPAWVENDWAGGVFRLGEVTATMLKPIVRCAATHVNPRTAERDLEVTKALFDHFGHLHCGVYLNVSSQGRVALGDACMGPATGKERTP